MSATITAANAEIAAISSRIALSATVHHGETNANFNTSQTTNVTVNATARVMAKYDQNPGRLARYLPIDEIAIALFYP